MKFYISRVVLDFRSTLCDRIIHNDDTKWRFYLLSELPLNYEEYVYI